MKRGTPWSCSAEHAGSRNRPRTVGRTAGTDRGGMPSGGPPLAEATAVSKCLDNPVGMVMQGSFLYSPETLEALQRSLSPARLATYDVLAGGSWEEAFTLYIRNLRLCQAFYTPLQCVEVALRNALHGLMSRQYGQAWFDSDSLPFKPIDRDHIAKAKKTVRNAGYEVTADRLVSSLTFGFWTGLLVGHYDRLLYQPLLYQAFPNHHAPRNRKALHREFNEIRRFRNRVAHHEPVFRRDLAADHQRIVRATGWICQSTAEWLGHHSRVPLVIDDARSCTASQIPPCQPDLNLP